MHFKNDGHHSIGFSMPQLSISSCVEDEALTKDLLNGNSQLTSCLSDT